MKRDLVEIHKTLAQITVKLISECTKKGTRNVSNNQKQSKSGEN